MRTMLLPLADEEADQLAIDCGFALAERIGAYPTFLLARPDYDIFPVYAHSVTSAGYAAMTYSLNNYAEARESALRQKLMAAAAERGISIALKGEARPDAQASFAIGRGEDDEVIRRFAAVNDVILFPRASSRDESLEAPSLLKSALEYSGRPILVVTEKLPDAFGTVIAIAWNGSTEGARAVTAALPILSRADEVIIFTAATGKTKADEGERLRKYLAHHGVRSRAERLEQESSVGQELISAACRSAASMLVSGGYTHSRMRQTLFGGVTHHLLENCTLPLLLAH